MTSQCSPYQRKELLKEISFRDILQHWYQKWSLTSTISITWAFVRNANFSCPTSEVPDQKHWRWSPPPSFNKPCTIGMLTKLSDHCIRVCFSILFSPHLAHHDQFCSSHWNHPLEKASEYHHSSPYILLQSYWSSNCVSQYLLLTNRSIWMLTLSAREIKKNKRSFKKGDYLCETMLVFLILAKALVGKVLLKRESAYYSYKKTFSCIRHRKHLW